MLTKYLIFFTRTYRHYRSISTARHYIAIGLKLKYVIGGESDLVLSCPLLHSWTWPYFDFINVQYNFVTLKSE